MPPKKEVEESEEGHKGRNVITPEMLELIKNADPTTGLTGAQAEAGLAKYGQNVLPSKHKSKLMIFLSYLTGPMAYAIEIAALVELVQSAITGQGWEDFGILIALLLLNASIGFTEEVKAGNAVEALKSKLAATTNVLRDGQWHELPAAMLVPGDLIGIKLGDAIPADCIMLQGNPVEVDQSGLTGESLPVEIKEGGYMMLGSMLKTGQVKAVVVATGIHTSYGEAAALIASVNETGHLRHVINSIVVGMLSLCVVICACIFARIMALPSNDLAMFVTNSSGNKLNEGLQALSIVIVILVASIPIAIEVVSTSTLAVGARTMSQKQVIVARLNAIEELAGMTVLCSDKTGTLTLNQLSLDRGLVMCIPSTPAFCAPVSGATAGRLLPASGDVTSPDVCLAAALASCREGKPDAIDLCIVENLDEEGNLAQKQWTQEHAIPFDPVSKRTIVTVVHSGGARVRVCKGAPQTVLALCNGNKDSCSAKVTDCVKDLAGRGYRALGVAVCVNPAPGLSSANSVVGDEVWNYMGVVPLFDPPRKDTRSTIEAAVANGIEVKMITGDQTAIAKETCKQLGMGTNILEAHVLDTTDPAQLASVDAIIMEAHGFAEVLPRHKFQIVERIRQMGHVTGMTGDGVNDAPALKRADIGIAVHGATDAARAAADIVLTEPGLSVIILAILESRKIFQRMRSYMIYRITCTVQILAFFFFIITCAELSTAYFYNGQYGAPSGSSPTDFAVFKEVYTGPLAHPMVFSLPVLALVFLTVINDGACIAVSTDTIAVSHTPQNWAVGEMWIVSSVMGLLLAFSSLILCVALMHANAEHVGSNIQFANLFGGGERGYILYTEAASTLFLQIAVSNMLTLVAARERGWWWNSFVSWQLGLSMFFAFLISTLLVSV